MRGDPEARAPGGTNAKTVLPDAPAPPQPSTDAPPRFAPGAIVGAGGPAPTAFRKRAAPKVAVPLHRSGTPYLGLHRAPLTAPPTGTYCSSAGESSRHSSRCSPTVSTSDLASSKTSTHLTRCGPGGPAATVSSRSLSWWLAFSMDANISLRSWSSTRAILSQKGALEHGPPVPNAKRSNAFESATLDFLHPA